MRFQALDAIILFLCASAGWESVAHAEPIELHVVGSMRLVANATESESGIQVRGHLADENEQPLAGQLFLPATERARPVACAGSSPTSSPLQVPATGEFCFELGDQLGPFRLVATAPHFAKASTEVHTNQPRRIPAPRFTQVPQVVDLNSPAPTVVEVLASSGSLLFPISLSLTLDCQGSTLPLATHSIKGSRLERFELSFPETTPPGQCLLSATSSGGELPSSLDTRSILVRAHVSLEASPLKNMASLSTSTVRASRGQLPVRSGVLEARSQGAFLLSSPVRDGEARLEFERELQDQSVTITYVSSDPSLVPDAPLIVDVPARASGFQWPGAHIALLLSFALWLGYAWLRPRDTRSASPVAPPPKVAQAQSTSGKSGRISGRILDAHTNAPLANARLILMRVDAESAEALEEISPNADGEFGFETEFGAHKILRIRATSPETMSLTTDIHSAELTIHLATRRRAVLGQLVEWARKRGAPWSSGQAPTPGRIGTVAARAQEHEVVSWAASVDEAAYAPAPPTEDRVRRLRSPQTGAK